MMILVSMARFNIASVTIVTRNQWFCSAKNGQENEKVHIRNDGYKNCASSYLNFTLTERMTRSELAKFNYGLEVDACIDGCRLGQGGWYAVIAAVLWIVTALWVMIVGISSLKSIFCGSNGFGKTQSTLPSWKRKSSL
jgi:hypothetical protein